MSLLQLPAERWQAIEVDLLDRGFTLDDVPQRLGLRVVCGLVRYAGRAGVDATYVDQHGPAAMWGPQEHILALTADLLNILVWQNTEDGSKGRNQPEMVTRPEDTERVAEMAEKVRASIAAAKAAGF